MRFSRLELMVIRERAERASEAADVGSWKRAYERLADAANALEVMQARSGATEPTNAEVQALVVNLFPREGGGS